MSHTLFRSVTSTGLRWKTISLLLGCKQFAVGLELLVLQKKNISTKWLQRERGGSMNPILI